LHAAAARWQQQWRAKASAFAAACTAARARATSAARRFVPLQFRSGRRLHRARSKGGGGGCNVRALRNSASCACVAEKKTHCCTANNWALQREDMLCGTGIRHGTRGLGMTCRLHGLPRAVVGCLHFCIARAWPWQCCMVKIVASTRMSSAHRSVCWQCRNGMPCPCLLSSRVGAVFRG
jgi:hypothetical protein